ncbi:hypothetical protein K8I31_04180 [bacterium]|nr:hypothetical protein [bacterium]
MARRIPLSNQHLDIKRVDERFNDAKQALRKYFDEVLIQDRKYIGFTKHELYEEREKRIREQEEFVSLSILAAIEARFRIDYEIRISKRLKDPLSKEFRGLAKSVGNYPRFEKDILSIWRRVGNTAASKLFTDLKKAFQYRHWLAHGRYWNLKSSNYDYHQIYSLADRVLMSLDLKQPKKIKKYLPDFQPELKTAITVQFFSI